MDDFLIFDTLPSTNEFALDLISENPSNGTAILALSQTKGRGQYGRVWDSSLGGLYLSIIIKNVILEGLTLKIGKIIQEFLQNLCKTNFEIKLPNDILFEGQKICGILIEAKTCGNNTYAVIGIGLNINNKWNNAPNLKEILRKELDCIEIAKQIRECILNGI